MTASDKPQAVAPATTLGEFAQAKIRCWMNLALISLTLLAHYLQPTLSLLTIWYTFLFTAASAASLLLWARIVSATPADSRARVWQRTASIFLDNISISWILYFGGETLSGVFSVYLWITIGYGMRFGLRYLYANLAASLAGFALVSSLSPFWNQYPSLALGLAMGLLVVPLYAAFLITQLHEAVRRAESASRAKGDFLAKMSHELRTPLHGIIALADLLAGTKSPAQKQEMLRQISVSSNTLLDLINRILDISKFESGAFALQNESMNLHAVLDDTISILSPQARAKGVALSFFCDATVENWVTGSPRQLQEVLTNLGGNALKFTERGSVRISMTGTTTASDMVGIRIAIADTGPGIPKDYLQRIFDPFSQADDSITRQHGGTGLGTTIARDLVRLMKGDISVESEVGVGTTVTIELTMARAAPPANPTVEYALKVVVVGSAESGRPLFRQLNALEVFDVHTATVDTVGPTDCILVDMTIRPDEFEVLMDTLKEAGHASVPLIGYGEATMCERAIELPLLSFVSLESVEVALKRALELVMLALSRADDEDENGTEGNGFSVLIAEDNATNQMIARIALERAGYLCTIVDDGEQALAELSSNRFDIALIDMHMPRMDGLELARLYNFAAFDAPHRTPIVMLTADNRPDVVADADLAGIARFIVKPIKPSVLLRIVHDLLAPMPTAEAPVLPEQSAVIPITPREAEAPEIDAVILGELLSLMESVEARRFFGEFREDAQRYISTVRCAAAPEQPFKKLRDDMHALCGAARTVGAMHLAALARRLEYSKEAEVRLSGNVLATELELALDGALTLIEQRLNAAA